MEETCKNCGNRFRGAFCNRCGQKVAHRLDLRHILHEAVHVITHTDRSIFALVPALLFRSGLIAREYVQGKRKRHFSIFQYLLIIVGVVLFAISQSHILDPGINSLQASPGSLPASQTQAVQRKVISTIQQYFNLVLFLSIPLFTYFSWLFFKSKRYNYAEHFVLQAAIQAQIHTWFLLLIFPLLLLSGGKRPEILIFLGTIVVAASNTLAYRQFFRVPWHQAFFKGFLIASCTNLVQLLVVLLCMAAITKW
jgi:hypothetical protein